MKNHSHVDLRDTQKFCDLLIAEILEKPQREDFGFSRIQAGQGAAQTFAQLAAVGFGTVAAQVVGRDVVDWDVVRVLAGPNNVQRRVNGCAPEIAFLAFHGAGGMVAAQHPQKYGLQYIFGVGRIARYAVSRAEDQAVVGLEHPLEVVGDRSNGFLPDRELQWATSCSFIPKDGRIDSLLQGGGDRCLSG